MEGTLKDRIKKIHMTEARQRDILAYASMDVNSLQKFDDKGLYNNHRYKKAK
jgi:hypothetical protein